MEYNPKVKFCQGFLPHYRTFPFWREKKFDRECKMATSTDVMTAAVGRVWGFSKGGTELNPLQGVSTGGGGHFRKRIRVNFLGGCVPANNLLRAEVLILRAEMP